MKEIEENRVIRYRLKEANREMFYECGVYKIDNNQFYYKEHNNYEFDKCHSITDEFYYDEKLGKKRKFRDLFHNKIVLQSKKYQSVLLLDSDFHLNRTHDSKDCECLSYQNIVSEDYSLIVTSLRSSGVI